MIRGTIQRRGLRCRSGLVSSNCGTCAVVRVQVCEVSGNAHVVSCGIKYVARLDRQRTKQGEAVCFKSCGIATSSYLRSEEHTSELQSRENLVCCLLLEKK